MWTVASILIRRWTVLALCLSISGCVHLFEDSMKSWVGAPLSEFQQKYKNDSKLIGALPGSERGTTVYAYSLTYLNPCTVYWTVNADGIITAWRHEGGNCHGVWP